MLSRLARELDAKVERILDFSRENVALFGFRKSLLKRIMLKDLFQPLIFWVSSGIATACSAPQRSFLNSAKAWRRSPSGFNSAMK